MRQIALFTTLTALLSFAVACGVGPNDELIEDNEAAGQVSLTGKADSSYGVSACVTTAALSWLNASTTTAATIGDLGLTSRAAGNIIAHRDGADATFGTADDDLFDDLLELDRVAWVGPKSIGRITASVEGTCSGGGGTPDPACLTKAALAWLNSAAATVSAIDALPGVSSTAAKNIVAHRDGADATFGTADDDLFDDLDELDGVSYVGPATIDRIKDSVKGQCTGGGGSSASAEVVFSPQSYSASHIQRIIKAIDAAKTSLDIAMYNLSDGNVEKALARAISRGVFVRAVTDNANADRSAPAGSKSARLEDLGINVRYVNKIMHHKFMLVDGPKAGKNDVAAKATLISGSGNWSSGAATRYDENTLFLTGVAELALRYQQEFNLMWNHSRDFVWDSTLPYAYAAALDLSAMVDAPAQHALFTSGNFKITGSDATTFSKVSGRNAVSDAIVAEIKAAKTSIHIASGHLRSRPIAEALIAAKKAKPSLDIKVYLDGQEYISYSTHKQQVSELNTCLAAAGTSVSKQQACTDKGFYFSYQLQDEGIDLKFKYYAYRWNYTYAKQMHHKYLVFDGTTLLTGSYNLSDNAEHNTFENVAVLRAPAFSALIKKYEQNFNSMWALDASGAKLAALKQTIATSSKIPLVFDAMALTQPQVQALKSLIVQNCADANSYDFRKYPEKHTVCYRD